MWFLIVLVVAVLWSILSIKIIGPAEMAVAVYFGNPIGFYDSGLCFVPFTFGLCYLKRYPKKIYNFDYKTTEVITKAGQETGIQYGAQKLKVNAAVYLSFPQEPEPGLDDQPHPLIKILRAGVPIEYAALEDWTEEAIFGALRLTFSQMTWVKAIEDMKTINQKVSEILKDTDGALIRAGFRREDIKLIICEIGLPKGVEDALPQIDKARLEADAAKDQAKRRAIEAVGTVLEMMAQSHGITREEINKVIQSSESLKKEFQQYAMDLNIRLSEADRGAFFDFRSPDAKGLDASILSLVALLKSMPSGGASGGKGGNPGQQGGSSGQGGKSVQQAAQEFFDQNDIWPRWDPLGRGKKGKSNP